MTEVGVMHEAGYVYSIRNIIYFLYGYLTSVRFQLYGKSSQLMHVDSYLMRNLYNHYIHNAYCLPA